MLRLVSRTGDDCAGESADRASGVTGAGMRYFGMYTPQRAVGGVSMDVPSSGNRDR